MLFLFFVCPNKISMFKNSGSNLATLHCWFCTLFFPRLWCMCYEAKSNVIGWTWKLIPFSLFIFISPMSFLSSFYLRLCFISWWHTHQCIASNPFKLLHYGCRSISKLKFRSQNSWLRKSKSKFQSRMIWLRITKIFEANLVAFQFFFEVQSNRALRYKLFFVKALTKRLRKLTIITKRL